MALLKDSMALRRASMADIRPRRDILPKGTAIRPTSSSMKKRLVAGAGATKGAAVDCEFDGLEIC